MADETDDIKTAAQGIVMSDPMMQIMSKMSSMGDSVLQWPDAVKAYLLRLKAKAAAAMPQTPLATPAAPIEQLLVKRRTEGR